MTDGIKRWFNLTSHPYIKLETTEEWKKIENGLKNLIKNKDLVLQTRPELVIGYLVSCLNFEKNKMEDTNKNELDGKSE